jgi:hypothetical protein
VRVRRAAAFAASAVALLDQVDAEADQAVTTAVHGVAGSAAVSAGLAVALQVRRAVVEAAVRDLLADLKAATSYTLSTARQLARAITRLSTIEGTPTEQAQALERVLRDRGLAAVVYRDGSRHGLAEYARMAVRTTRTRRTAPSAASRKPARTPWRTPTARARASRGWMSAPTSTRGRLGRCRRR